MQLQHEFDVKTEEELSKKMGVCFNIQNGAELGKYIWWEVIKRITMLFIVSGRRHMLFNCSDHLARSGLIKSLCLKI